MCFWKKKSKEQVAREDKVDMQAVYARAKQIGAAAEEGSEAAKKIAAIAEELKYFAPTSKPGVIKTDKKIADAVDDLRPLVVGKKPEEKILEQVKEINVLIEYRKASLETEI